MTAMLDRQTHHAGGYDFDCFEAASVKLESGSKSKAK
jgi:hypothetical protein